MKRRKTHGRFYGPSLEVAHIFWFTYCWLYAKETRKCSLAIFPKKGGKKELNEQLAISVKVEIIYFGSVSHSIECGFEGWSILWYGFGGWVCFLSTEIFNEKFSLFRTW